MQIMKKRTLKFFHEFISNFKSKNESDHHIKVIEVIKTLLNNQLRVAFDVGAHYGSYSKALNIMAKDAQIHCFEPFPEAFCKLKNNLINNNNVHLYQIALSDINGNAKFYINNSEETNSLLPSAITNSEIDNLTQNNRIIDVSVRTLDSICQQQNIVSIDLLKIDAQGNTLNILTGAIQLLKSLSIKVIQCETEFLEIYISQSLFPQTAVFLEKYGYFLYSLYNIHYDVNQRISWADAVYVKND
ncbi:MAG: methyltransferase FkbM family [Daejeonella sp.]|nr:methyltransferase FkbM family [Daejeonella sp.]